MKLELIKRLYEGLNEDAKTELNEMIEAQTSRDITAESVSEDFSLLTAEEKQEVLNINGVSGLDLIEIIKDESREIQEHHFFSLLEHLSYKPGAPYKHNDLWVLEDQANQLIINTDIDIDYIRNDYPGTFINGKIEDLVEIKEN